MRLSPAERETIILFSDADRTASVYTHDKKLTTRLETLARQYPDQVYVERQEHPGAVSYIVPKSCIQIHAPFSAQRREAARQRALKSGFQRKSTEREP